LKLSENQPTGTADGAAFRSIAQNGQYLFIWPVEERMFEADEGPVERRTARHHSHALA